MKANIKLSVILLGIVFAFSFSSCERIKFDEDENASIRDARNTLQEYETDGGDFAFLKSVIGMEVSVYDEYLTGNGYVECENSNAKYLDTRVDSISKYLHVHLSSGERIQNAEINVKNNDFDTLYAVFKTWMLEISRSSSYQLLVRKTFEMSTGWYSGYQYFDTPEQLLEAAESVSPMDELQVSFYGNDNQAFEYSLIIDYRNSKTVYMQIMNERVNTPLPEVPTVNLTEEYLGKDILIAKVDYMTFEYGGFYSMNVTNKQNEGNEIPFLADYMSPSDFGYIKLYYRDQSNLLMDGSIIWAGCGELNFPETFVKGNSSNTYVPEYTMKRGLSFPSDRISYIDADGSYVQDVDESDNDLGYIWQTLSDCEEFMSYYEQTSKKVAVYLYQPSVGMGDPYDWYYMVFVER
ncbi:MAG: hypothetical protein IKJ56_08000 [Bacteroidales bacterium]|nr:hypothetical protein [Bacteroidales bacterium]